MTKNDQKATPPDCGMEEEVSSLKTRPGDSGSSVRSSTLSPVSAAAKAKAGAAKACLPYAKEEIHLKLEKAKLEAPIEMLNSKKEETAAAIAEGLEAGTEANREKISCENKKRENSPRITRKKIKPRFDTGWKKEVERGNRLELYCDAGYATGHINVGAHAGATVSAAGFVEVIDTIDRPGKAFAKGCYAGTDKTAVAFKNKPGERLPKAELSAAAGVGHARAEWGIFEADAKGPNAGAGVGASVASLGAEAFAKAEVASASAAAGPLKVKVGLAADTGVGVGLTGFDLKVLGTGISFGRKMGFCLFGNEISFKLW